MPQLSQSGRVVRCVEVSQGYVYVSDGGDDAFTGTDNNTGANPPLQFTGVLYSTVCNLKLFFADGVNWVYYDPHTNSCEEWVSTAGDLPVDDLNNKPRLICTWRGRVVLSGLLLDPQNWFMSRINDPFDFEYFPVDPDGAQAVAGNNALAGLVGDIVTSLCPFNDDVLIFFCDHSIWTMTGDPNAGGQLDLVTDTIGSLWGIPWCRDPAGNVYFMSNKMGVYVMRPGAGEPQRISRQIDPLLEDIDTGHAVVRLGWDDSAQGLYLFLTTGDGPTAEDVHYFWEQRTNGWFQVTFDDPNMNPCTLTTFDGNEPGDRALIIGSWDGYVRTFSKDAADDDGSPIRSSVVVGPFTSKTFDDLLLSELQGEMAEDSGDVTWEVYRGTTAEIALSNPVVTSGTFTAGRGYTQPVRCSGHGLYVKLSSTDVWAMEKIRVRLSSVGATRRRGVSR